MRGLMYLYEFPINFRLLLHQSSLPWIYRLPVVVATISPEDVWYKITLYRDDVIFTILRAFDTLYFFNLRELQHVQRCDDLP
jgi:hypothetical protein